jgi:hypothetical protein
VQHLTFIIATTINLLVFGLVIAIMASFIGFIRIIMASFLLFVVGQLVEPQCFISFEVVSFYHYQCSLEKLFSFDSSLSFQGLLHHHLRHHLHHCRWQEHHQHLLILRLLLPHHRLHLTLDFTELATSFAIMPIELFMAELLIKVSMFIKLVFAIGLGQQLAKISVVEVLIKVLLGLQVVPF